jgi:hypothetical protein
MLLRNRPRMCEVRSIHQTFYPSDDQHAPIYSTDISGTCGFLLDEENFVLTIFPPRDTLSFPSTCL